jgi:hypothetical protein
MKKRVEQKINFNTTLKNKINLILADFKDKDYL